MAGKFTGIFVLCLSFHCIFAQPWSDVFQFGGTDNEGLSGLLIDGEGGRILAGSFEGSIEVNGSTIQSFGDKDVFLGRLGDSGTFEWLIGGGSSLKDEVVAIRFDQQENILGVGAFWFEASFGEVQLSTNLNPKALMLFKYTPEGAPLWFTVLEGSALKEATDLAVDDVGNSYVCGYFSDTLQIDTSTLVAIGESDSFVAKFDPNGALIWLSRQGFSKDVRGMSLDVLPNGGIAMAGVFNDRLVINSDTLISNTFDLDVFVTHLDNDGNPVWVQKAGGVHDDEVVGLQTDQLGNIYLTGYLVGVMTLSESISIQSSTGNADFYLLKYDIDGNVLFGKAMGGNLYQESTTLLLSPNGQDILIGGIYQGDMNIDGFQLEGGIDFKSFVAAFNSDGNAKWVKTVSGDGFVLVEELALFSTGRLLVGGVFNQTLDLENEDSLSSIGDYDVFLLKTDNLVPSADLPIEMEVGVRIFPNPVTTELQIETDLLQFDLAILNSSGQLVFSGKNLRKIPIASMDMPPGIYMLQLQNEKVFWTGQFVVE